MNPGIVLREIAKNGESNIVLDVVTHKLGDLLRHAQRVGIVNEYHNFIVTTLDLHTVDLTALQNSGTNLTGFMLLKREVWEQDIGAVREKYTKTGLYPLFLTHRVSGKQIRTDTALTQDALIVLVRAIQNLAKARALEVPPRFICRTSPAERNLTQSNMLKEAVRKQLAGSNVTLLCGNFNAQHTAWGYPYTTAKGHSLYDETMDAGYQLLNDPNAPTRNGTSSQRDTNPDLAFISTASALRGVTWRNTGETLGSDHCILEITIPIAESTQRAQQQQIVDWHEYRKKLEDNVTATIENIEAWTSMLNATTKDATQTVEVEPEATMLDSRLAHLMEARNSLRRRWKRQRHNRKLRKRIAQLNRDIEHHSAVLCRQQCHAVCQKADSPLHKGKTWRLLRHLLNDQTTKGAQHYMLNKTIHKAVKEMGEAEVQRRLDAKYLPVTPTDPLPSYVGATNERLDADVEEWEVRAVLQTINCKSASGPDHITNKALMNLNNTAIEALTKYYNQCWRTGKLPQQWKTAKTNINVITQDRTPIPHVQTLRVLGPHLQDFNRNNVTVQKLHAKLSLATRLLKKVATRYQGMREDSLLRLTQPFAVSHISYVASFHSWKAAEKIKIAAMIRKAYKTALGLYPHTNTERMLALGIHNTLEEIAEAQRTAQYHCLSQTRTGRTILQRIGIDAPATTPEVAKQLPRDVLQRLRVPPLPKHMHPQIRFSGLSGPLWLDASGQRRNVSLLLKPKTCRRYCLLFRVKISRMRSRFQNTSRVCLTRCLLQNAPYVMLKKSAHKLEGNDRFEGFCVDLLQEISATLGFRYRLKLVRDGAYGIRDSQGRWNGIMRELVDIEADLAIGDLTITSEREQSVDFTMPFMTLGVSILYKKTEQRRSLLFFLSPLSGDVWLCVAGACVAVSVILCCVARAQSTVCRRNRAVSRRYGCCCCGNSLSRSDEDWYTETDSGGAMLDIIKGQEAVGSSELQREMLYSDSRRNSTLPTMQSDFTLPNSCWFIVSAIMRQECGIFPRAASAHIIAATWWIFSFVLVSSYTANLAAFLTKERLLSPIESAEDLAKQSAVRYGCVRSGSTHALFKKRRHETYEMMWHAMKEDLVSSIAEGIERVERGGYAFVMESTSIEYVVRRRCQFKQIGGLLDSKGYGIATPHGSPYRNILSSTLLRLQERGTLQKLKDRWWKVRDPLKRCPTTEAGKSRTDAASELGLQTVGGVFVVLLAGLGLACLIAFAELFCEARLGRS
ncbi:uncharacterized protein LOC142784609 [Rhipicephalus microplus]|uniref:uncharacterized protein LOC142784609 n=1 Tax=Rhipicephalus microplus TaxID=6941 RepID=UPI003F6C1025